MSQRNAEQLREARIEQVHTGAAGAVEIHMGRTRVMCTASLSTDPPKWLAEVEPPRGWVTAEYAMLPGSSPQRSRRGGDGRATEIQRLIGRSLRAGVDLEKMPGVAIICDCDVLCADGGTRTASITGAYVALAHAIATARERGLIEADPLTGPVAAVSVGICEGRPTLDLDYKLDRDAEVDMNVVMNGSGRFVEVQGTAESGTFSREQLDALLELAGRGIEQLIELQRQAIAG